MRFLGYNLGLPFIKLGGKAANNPFLDRPGVGGGFTPGAQGNILGTLGQLGQQQVNPNTLFRLGADAQNSAAQAQQRVFGESAGRLGLGPSFGAEFQLQQGLDRKSVV